MAFSLLPYFLNRWHYEISAKLLNLRRSNFRVELSLKSEGAHGALLDQNTYELIQNQKLNVQMAKNCALIIMCMINFQTINLELSNRCPPLASFYILCDKQFF
jgi:hypothetical protein